MKNSENSSLATDPSMYRYPYQNLSLVDMPGEIWRPVPGLEGYVVVSNLGRIKRLARIYYSSNGRKNHLKEMIMTQKISNHKIRNGIYDFISPVFSIMIQNNRKLFTVARVVYSAFVERLDHDPAKNHKQLILHKDLDGLNNKVENLYLATNKELSERNFKLCIMPNEKSTVLCSKPISQYDLSGVFIRTYPSINEAKRQTGISSSKIIGTAKGKQSQAGGFIWRYASKNIN